MQISHFYLCAGQYKKIKDMTFSGCKAAVDITISEGGVIIGEGASQNITVRSVVLPEGEKQIGDYAFNNAAKRTSIGTNAFVVGWKRNLRWRVRMKQLGPMTGWG